LNAVAGTPYISYARVPAEALRAVGIDLENPGEITEEQLNSILALAGPSTFQPDLKHHQNHYQRQIHQQHNQENCQQRDRPQNQHRQPHQQEHNYQHYHHQQQQNHQQNPEQYHHRPVYENDIPSVLSPLPENDAVDKFSLVFLDDGSLKLSHPALQRDFLFSAQQLATENIDVHNLTDENLDRILQIAMES
uniref:CAC1F_C domain-containing protein n=1 Tax=Gongylonema pulchrum TaxID=637853 RepID=A0A183D5B1_9BILA